MIAILSARRTPQGRFLKGLSSYSAADLGQVAAAAVLDNIPRDALGAVIVGNVLAAGNGLNVARQVAQRAGVPDSVPAFTVNQACASGIQAIVSAARMIYAGDAEVVLCGGVESMSNAPHLLPAARGRRMGCITAPDAMLSDGFLDPILGEHMGRLTDRLAAELKISRERQDVYAHESQQRTAAAIAAGHYAAELVPVGDVTADEHPRPDTTLQRLARLTPAFCADGTITAGNASGINDGAAMVVIASEQAAIRLGIEPLACLRGYAEAGCDPRQFALGTVHAVRALLRRYGRRLAEFDWLEINEAFAAQVLACMDQLGLPLHSGRSHVNPDGGAIALGHPVGASAARLVVHLAHQIAAGRSRSALATVCVGGGMGAAVAFGAPMPPAPPVDAVPIDPPDWLDPAPADD